MGGDACERLRPWTVNVGGPARTEDDAGLLFTPDFPCGAEFDELGVLRGALHKIAEWGGCVGDQCPEGRVLIAGQVLSIETERAAGGLSSLSIGECQPNVQTSQPRLKLAVTSCGNPGKTFFDADGALVVPAGPCKIELWGPATWDQYGHPSLAAPGLWCDTQVKVTACPLDGFAPVMSTLTMWGQVDIAAAIADRIIVRPRRARTVQAGAVAAGGVASTLNLSAAQDPAGVRLLAFFSCIATQQHTILWGDAPFAALGSPAGVITAYVRWGIE